MFYIGLYIRIAPPLAGAAVPDAGYVALVCIFLFAAFFQFGWDLSALFMLQKPQRPASVH